MQINAPAAAFERVFDRALDGTDIDFARSVARTARRRNDAQLRVGEVFAQMLCAGLVALGWIEIARTNRCEEHDLFSRARDGDIQTPLATSEVERAEVVIHHAVGIAAVADGKQHGRALIALHILEVFNEDLFAELCRLGHALAKLAILVNSLVEQILHQRLLRLTESHHAERAIGGAGIIIKQPARELRHHRHRLDAIGRGISAVVNAANKAEFDAEIGMGAVRSGEGLQRSAITFAIGKLNQTLVARAVVPVQRERTKSRGDGLVEHALEIFKLVAEIAFSVGVVGG